MTVSIESTPFKFARYCSESYTEARERFLDGIDSHPAFIRLDSIKIAAKGPNGEALYTDIALIGNPKGTDIIIHFSGTHGVEGFAGAAIQQSLLKEPLELGPNTLLILVLGVNPSGMAHFRRVTENNVDVNRNLIKEGEGISPPTYAKINALMNPQEKWGVDFFHLRLLFYIAIHGWGEIKSTLATGQYDFEEGLFYGGKEIEEAPKNIMNWMEAYFTERQNEKLNVSILDVHTGLGPYAEDTLLTLEPPTEKMVSIFGKRIQAPKQEETTGYTPVGMFCTALKELVERVSSAANVILVTGQEFGTVPVYQVMMALRNENRDHHIAKRNGQELSPNHASRQELLRVFYPKESEWRHLVVKRGRELIMETLQLHNN